MILWELPFVTRLHNKYNGMKHLQYQDFNWDDMQNNIGVYRDTTHSACLGEQSDP